jgi:hypothetical protein
MSVSGCSCPWQLKQLNWLNEEKAPWQVLQSTACGPAEMGNLWFARVTGESSADAPGWHASKASNGRQNRRPALVVVMLLRRVGAMVPSTPEAVKEPRRRIPEQKRGNAPRGVQLKQ